MGYGSNTETMLRKVSIAAIFNTMRILKRVNPGGAYYENYLGHLQRNGETFFDTYMLLWEIAASSAPKRILEIGTRTGISLCQLLSGYVDQSAVERVLCIDPFSDGFTSPGLVRANLKSLNISSDKVEIRTGLSQEILPSLTEEFDYILVDGDHSKEAARHDLEYAAQMIAEGGIIVFDDISDAPGECALIDVWQDWQRCHADDFEFDLNMSGKGVAWAVKK